MNPPQLVWSHWQHNVIILFVFVRETRTSHALRSHGSVRVVRTTSKVNGKCWNLTPKPTQNPLSDRHQIWRAWLRHGYLQPRKWRQSLKGFRLFIYVKYIYMFATHVFYFFGVFQWPRAEMATGVSLIQFSLAQFNWPARKPYNRTKNYDSVLYIARVMANLTNFRPWSWSF